MVKVQWRGDNLAAIQALLSRHEIQVEKAGDWLYLLPVYAEPIAVNLGDALELDGDRLGIHRIQAVEH